MDNRARAEKIARENIFILKQKSSDPLVTDVCIRENIINVITTQLDEACKLAEAQGYVQGQIDGTKREEKKWCGRGFATGIEKAAQVAVDELNLIAGPGISPKETDLAYGTCIDIAKRIRALKADE